MKSKMLNYSAKELQEIFNNSSSYKEVLMSMGMSPHGSNYITLRKIIDEYDLDLSVISQNRDAEKHKILETNRKEIPIGDIIYSNIEKDFNGQSLKRKLINEGIKEEKCEKCGNTMWMGQKIHLHLHHKDGNHKNNYIENLQFLCPNCHAMTENYAGKRIQHNKIVKNMDRSKTKKGISEDGLRLYDGYGGYKVLCPVCGKNYMEKVAKKCRECYENERIKPKIEKKELYDLLQSHSYNEVGKIYGVDRKTIKSWHRYYAKQDKANGVITIVSDKAPDMNTLQKDIESKTMESISQKYGVSSNTVRKWCIRYGLEFAKERK